MNFAKVTLPNFGSGSISRFAATRLLGIDKPLILGLQADLSISMTNIELSLTAYSETDFLTNG
jgi:hypothetical protein